MVDSVKLDIDALESIAKRAREYHDKPWRRDGRTVWRGDWTKDGQQHPVVTFHVTDGNGCERFINEPPPKGTEATLDHIAAASPDVVLSLIAKVRELQARIGEAESLALDRDTLD